MFMKILHLALATNNLVTSIADYSKRLGAKPCVIIANEYALWRTPQVNLSIRQDNNVKQGELRHLGFEDSKAKAFTSAQDTNGIVWESFAAPHQADEINRIWPSAGYKYTNFD
jgi:hypothetical protein